ncbi:LppX_LprAFG lipoprotein [Mycolicibacter terrae]|uniref:LppX_LprAFG lipoprotein n=1 Tax=Mycolicibacter terrae TaxID=1788 RepID=A0ACD2ES78_9MYCO|nr:MULTISPECIES: LppX_LprAFG lipoprotein [Mycolicibacter]RRR47869.1 LppX_LprAFG lipoprotein [Mycolicibacter terrae]
MRRLPAVLTVVSAAAVLFAGCSSSPSPPAPTPSSATATSSATSPTTVPPSAAPATSSPTSPSPTSSKKASEPLPDAAAILKESSATTADLDSVHLSMSVTGNIENLAITALDGDVTRRPDDAAKGYAKIAYRGAPAYVKFVVFGGDLYVSQSSHRWVDYGPAGNFYDPATILSPATGLADLLTDFIDPEVSGRETIDGVHTVRVTGEVSAAAAKKIVPQLHANKRTSCTVWIQETGDHHLVRLELASGADNSVQLTFSNWNAPVSVGKPRM